jgi:hypothetical protein
LTDKKNNEKKGCNCRKSGCLKKVLFFLSSIVNAKLKDFNALNFANVLLAKIAILIFKINKII